MGLREPAIMHIGCAENLYLIKVWEVAFLLGDSIIVLLFRYLTSTWVWWTVWLKFTAPHIVGV